MPLDAANHLAAQGWAGAGKPLRAGPNALSRPIVGVQKKTLGGVGKDRDDAFAFWDHVYAVSAQTIKIKLHNDSDTEESAGSSPPPPSQQQLDRTSTGLISNRRPTGSQTPASSSTSTSGTSTPVTTSSEPSPSSGSRVSVMAAAKKQAARLELYRRFYVGPVIGPDHHQDESEPKPSSSMDAGDSSFAQSQSTDAELPFASTSESSSTMVVDELDEEAERKAAKAAKKAAREAKRQRKEEKRRKAEKVAPTEQGLKKAKRGKRKPQSDETQSEASCTVSESEKAGQKRKRDENEEEAGPSTDTKDKSVSPARKKKRVKLIMPIPRPTIKYSPSRGPCEKKGILRAPALNPSSPKEQGGSDGEKGKRVTFTKTVISHTVARWWEEAGWSDEGI